MISPGHQQAKDLKPENLLLAVDGCLKLTDMGLAKFVAASTHTCPSLENTPHSCGFRFLEVVGKTYTTCGTPDYFAPELIASTGHTNAAES